MATTAAAKRTVPLALLGATRTVLAEGQRVYLVKVSGMYLTSSLGLAGEPAMGHVHTELREAWKVAWRVRRRRTYLGRVHVVRRRDLKPPQW